MRGTRKAYHLVLGNIVRSIYRLVLIELMQQELKNELSKNDEDLRKDLTEATIVVLVLLRYLRIYELSI